MTLLSREQILQANDLKTADVDCPEWGGTVRVRSLTGAERDRLEAVATGRTGRTDGKPTMLNMRARAVSMAAVDADGHRLFTDADIATLGKKSSAPIQRLFEKITEMSASSEEDEEEMAADFDKDPGGSSTSG